MALPLAPPSLSSYFSVTNRSLTLQVHVLCSGLPVMNLMVQFLYGMFSLEGQEGSVLFLPCRQCVLSEGGETQILFLLIFFLTLSSSDCPLI